LHKNRGNVELHILRAQASLSTVRGYIIVRFRQWRKWLG